jgi:glycosyltransferase involved in cell wall biosynthesis
LDSLFPPLLPVQLFFMKSLRILLVLNEAPLPFGHALGRWYSVLLKGLVERGHQVTAYATCANAKDLQETRELFPSPSFDLRPYSFPERKDWWRKLTTLRRPFSYVIHPELRRDLHTELRRRFDILHLEGIWSGWLGEGCSPSRVVLNFHNLYDIDLPRQPGLDWRNRIVRVLRRRAEHRLLKSYGTLLTLTPRLRDAVRSIAPKTPIHVVPLGLDAQQYPLIPSERRLKQPIITLIGSMSWYPSYSAAVRLLTRLLPKLRREIPEIRVVIVGWYARSALRAFLPISGVEVLENVPDVRPFFEKSSLLLYAPERGSGMKVKVLEAFAYGVPVVTTSEGVEGIPAWDGIHAGISDEDAGLVERSLDLLKNPVRQESQRRAARALVEQHCHPSVVLDGVERCYEDILARARRQAA